MRNSLLAALPAAELERWRVQLDWVELSLGDVLNDTGKSPTYAYFPVTAVVSLLCATKNGESSAIAVVGNEGLVGVSLLMGGGLATSRAVVHSAGAAYRMSAKVLIDEVNRHGPTLSLMLRYINALFIQVAQTAVCNRHHALEQQLCRWLLLNLDRLNNAELLMTQELLANLLGVRRESVTENAIKLQDAGVIHYSRGHIYALNRTALEARSCECYAVVKKEYDRLLFS
ncbi:Crp/Fnr family transcriptional regulator [Polaromonas vacuolata]|nr:Crp/Fnr family transcriptional regulator [Polaromonas vacuolata]